MCETDVWYFELFILKHKLFYEPVNPHSHCLSIMHMCNILKFQGHIAILAQIFPLLVLHVQSEESFDGDWESLTLLLEVLEELERVLDDGAFPTLIATVTTAAVDASVHHPLSHICTHTHIQKHTHRMFFICIYTYHITYQWVGNF